ncbi:MAG TPA: zinc-binding dehydrogenase [Mycobacteriales bacterium]|nr:zinc-binding dehydrogenase [Mycobacteriales bacterium]
MRALMMLAAGGAENSRVEDVEIPRPGPGDVSIEVAYAGLNFMDVMSRRGDPGYVAGWPHRPGLEVSGTVREVGPQVTGPAVGDVVAASIPAGGGMAEIAVARAELTVPVPAGVPLAVAAGTPAGFVSALLLLEAGRFTAGETVLVHSASGGVGSAVAQFARALGGGRLLGTVGRPEKVEAAVEAGYDTVVARGQAAAESLRTAGGVDLVLDPLGTSALDFDLDIAAPRARIVLFGNASGGEIGALPPVGRLIGGNLTLTGFSHRATAATAPQLIAAATTRTLDLVAAGSVEFPVTVVDSLDEVPGIHDRLAAGTGSGKYVVRIGR